MSDQAVIYLFFTISRANVSVTHLSSIVKKGVPEYIFIVNKKIQVTEMISNPNYFATNIIVLQLYKNKFSLPVMQRMK